MIELVNLNRNSDYAVRSVGNALCTFRVTWSGHRKILSILDLQPKNESTVGMPRFYWILRENIDRKFDSVVWPIREAVRSLCVASQGHCKILSILETLT